MLRKVLKRVFEQTLDDVLASAYKTAINFRLYDSTEYVGYFMGFHLVEMCEHSGCPKLTPRFLCFDTDGKRTQCDPQFENISDDIAYYKTMRQLGEWEQQTDITQELNAITQLHAKQIQTRS